MKKILFAIAIIVLVSQTAFSEETLNSYATYIKNNYYVQYEQNIKKHALDKWPNNFSMAMYSINNQCKALSTMVKTFKPENTKIAYFAIKKWSYSGYTKSNMKKFFDFKIFDMESLLEIHADWHMTSYSFNKQVLAKEGL